MKNLKSTTTGKKALAIAMAVLILMVGFSPIEASHAAAAPYLDVPSNVPTIATGRILTKDKAGDTSDWVEIAKNGNYSLIIRKNYINIYPRAGYANKPDWQNSLYSDSTRSDYMKPGYVKNDYMKSLVRRSINDWFNGKAGTACDNLPANARLRGYTMQIFPQINTGTGNYKASLTDGFSVPTIYQNGVGEDVAFALSYGEAANFCSRYYDLRDSYIQVNSSNSQAVANYNKLAIVSGSYGMWLRSPGDNSEMACGIFFGTGTSIGTGRVFQFSTESTSDRVLIYPAVWVKTTIFDAGNASFGNIAEVPVIANGRVLTKEQTGDTSEWVEIAQNGDYSLIVRKTFLNIYNQGQYRGDPTWNCEPYGATNLYYDSNPRRAINSWFNGTAKGGAERLPYTARLRNFTAQTDIKYKPGTSSTVASLTNGFSKPTIYQVGIGNDIAFAMSFGEAANFCSTTYTVRNSYYANLPSPLVAQQNQAKLSMPDLYLYGMWLRSPGDVSSTAGCLTNRETRGRVFQAQIDPNTNMERMLVYPALWVGKGIFQPDIHWFQITYDMNGGIGPNIVEDADYNGVNGSLIVRFYPMDYLDKPGYIFAGWNTQPNGTGASYTPGKEYLITSDITVYAIWNKNPWD